MNTPKSGKLARALVLAVLLPVGCATPNVLEGPAQAPPPALTRANPEASAPPYGQLACATLVRNGGAEFDSERPTMNDRLPKLLERVAEGNRCWEAKLISNADLSALLRMARQRLVEWYELDARGASAILLGDMTADSTKPRRGRQSWAAIYLGLMERLTLLEGPAVSEGMGLSEQMLRVDAQAVRMLDRLQRSAGRDPLDREVAAAAVAFQERLAEEAASWPEHLAGLTMPRAVPTNYWSPEDRISQVATLVYWIATRWGGHSVELHRDTIGAGFHGYLEAFWRAEAHAPLDERLRVTWPMYVHTPSITERGTSKRVDEVLQDIGYDRLNLPVYFAMRDAQTAWLSLLPSAPEPSSREGLPPEAAEQRWKQAAHALMRAWEGTTSRKVRLQSIAGLINQADLVFVQTINAQSEPIPGGDPRIAPGAILAELGLCLMNQSLFEGAHSPCPAIPAPDTVRLQPGEQAWCPKDPEVAGEFVEQAPPEVLEAYRRVLGALVVAGEPLTERTQCGVLSVLRGQALASLHADASLLQAGMDLVEAGRVTLGPQRMGEFLAAALPRLRMDVTAPCIRLGLGSSCSLPEILKVVSNPPASGIDRWLELWRGKFCTSVKAGARVIGVADGLLSESQPGYAVYLSPLTAHQLNDYRSDFLAASTACHTLFPNDVDQTPDVWRPDIADAETAQDTR